jgi:hypothetical protein
MPICDILALSTFSIGNFQVYYYNFGHDMKLFIYKCNPYETARQYKMCSNLTVNGKYESRVLSEKPMIIQLVKKFPSFYGTQWYLYYVHKMLPLDHILSQMNPVHTVTSLFS